ncbi:MAG: preprotein translocase subunit SecE [Lachnospiraceae bacterium]|jgi:preprotein translocase subunit SecE|nr:preprotein translocase subunit SecE [Lachnospiraceae bacterium]
MAKDKIEKKQNKHFVKDFKSELKKVVWPTPKQLVNSTISVITIVLIVALLVFVLDFCFELLNKSGINKLKEVVTNSNAQVSPSPAVETETLQEDPADDSTVVEPTADTNAGTENTEQ